MSEAWDGRPPGEAADNSWHWLEWCDYSGSTPSGHVAAYRWEKDGWWDGSMHRHARYWPSWRYLGPCLTPAHAAAAALAEREACAAVCERDVRSPLAKEFGHCPDWFTHALRCAAAIRARPAPSGADALAAALRDAQEKARAYLARLIVALHPTCEPLPDLMGACTQIDNVLTEIPQLRAALRQARAEGMRRAAEVARNACLVPPDGGSPTEAEADMCDTIAAAILAAAEAEERGE